MYCGVALKQSPPDPRFRARSMSDPEIAGPCFDVTRLETADRSHQTNYYREVCVQVKSS
jgi:hypothetical protein